MNNFTSMSVGNIKEVSLEEAQAIVAELKDCMNCTASVSFASMIDESQAATARLSNKKRASDISAIISLLENDGKGKNMLDTKDMRWISVRHESSLDQPKPEKGLEIV